MYRFSRASHSTSLAAKTRSLQNRCVGRSPVTIFLQRDMSTEPTAKEWKEFKMGKRAVLELEDGTKLEGVSFGANKVACL